MSEPHETTLSSNGDKLAVTTFKADAPNGRGILFIHGWQSSQQSPRQFARKLAELGFTTLVFDSRGCGRSEGDIQKLTRPDFLNDCLVAYEHLKTHVSDISAVGSSFGAYLACLLSSRLPLSTLVLRVPANYPDVGFESQPQAVLSHRVTEEHLMLPEDSTQPSLAVDALSVFEGPALIVESENDEVVPHESVMRYVNAARNGTHVIVPGAPHALVTADLRRQFQEQLVNWFTTH
jgi:uncharacterized protein